MDTVTALPQVAIPRETGAAPMPRSRVWRAYAIEAKYESLRMLRAPAFAGPFLLLPAGLYLLFGAFLFSSDIAKDPKTALFMFMGFTVMGVMGPGMFGFGITVATDREHGLLKLKRALPAPPAASLLAKMLMSMLFVAIVMASMAAVAPLGHLHLSAPRMLALSLVNVVGAAPFCALGFLIGSLASAKSAPAFVNLLYLPMIYLSGILFPLPKSAEWVAYFSPASYLDQAGLAVIGAAGHHGFLLPLALLAAVTVACTVLAVRRLARHG
jgi:ABC-2 type transport system permease protein